MESSFWFDKVNLGWFFVSGSCRLKFLNRNVSLKIFFVFANSVDADEMPHHDAAFHLGLHCLPKYVFRSH